MVVQAVHAVRPQVEMERDAGQWRGPRGSRCRGAFGAAYWGYWWASLVGGQGGFCPELEAGGTCMCHN